MLSSTNSLPPSLLSFLPLPSLPPSSLLPRSSALPRSCFLPPTFVLLLFSLSFGLPFFLGEPPPFPPPPHTHTHTHTPLYCSPLLPSFPATTDSFSGSPSTSSVFRSRQTTAPSTSMRVSVLRLAPLHSVTHPQTFTLTLYTRPSQASPAPCLACSLSTL